MSARSAVILIWICFIVQGVFYASVMPLWDGFDEFSHYAFLEDIALHHRLAKPDEAYVSREVAESLRAAPVPWMIRDWQPDWLSYDGFWKLSDAERAARLQRLRAIPPELAFRTDPARIADYEARQPPLAYAILSAPYLWLRSLDLPSRAWALRIFCVLIASALVPFTFLALRQAFNRERVAIAGSSLAIAFPQIYFYTARVSNDGLAVALGAALVWLLIRIWRVQRGIAPAAIVLGCALLTKAYFLPVAVAAAAVVALRCGRRAAPFAVIPAAIAGWWYLRIFHLTGSLTGEQVESAAARHADLLHAALHAHWLRIADFALLSHIWLGGWSFLVVRAWMYRVVEALFALAIAGLALHTGRTAPPVRIAVALEAAFCAGMAAHAVAASAAGSAGTFGYYAFAVLPAEVICLIAGWQALGRSLARFAPFGATFSLAAVSAFGLFIYAIPYYAGITAHDASGNLHAIAFRAIAATAPLEFERLTWGKPGLLSPPALISLAVLFLAACLLNCAIAWPGGVTVARRSPEADGSRKT